MMATAIIAALVAVLLPAVQRARESARLASCKNNLKNMGVGLSFYHDVHRQFPCGGWGHEWVGMPERGVGQGQPGGWIYAALPFLEEGHLHDLGAGATGAAAVEKYSQRLQTPIAIFVCPSRRPCQAWPVSDSYAFAKTPRPFGNVAVVARADYAINAGANHIFGNGGPVDLAQGDDPKYWRTGPAHLDFNGISHLRCGATLKSIVDGTSKTYLVGEKRVPADNYTDGSASGDSVSLYAGYGSDLHRFTGVLESLKVDRPPFAPPISDHAPAPTPPAGSIRFGSAHPSGFNMMLCDGSVEYLSFDVDPDVHLRAGHRKDQGRPLDSLN
jgi:prepilin-type processing-associated H-X9-DG protein